MVSKIISTNPAIMADEIQRLKEVSIKANTSIENINSSMGVLGAKNLNSFPYYNDSRTIADIVWTVNADGSLSATGTASSNSSFSCHSRNVATNKLVLPNGKYIVNGCPEGGSDDTWSIIIARTYNGVSDTICINTVGDTEFTLNGDDYSTDEVQVQLLCRIMSGKQVSGLVFKPMIRLASVESDTWEPYANTNKQLTDDVAALNFDLRCTKTTAGTYKLEATVDARGAITYEWVEVV